jgi:uncharacterized Zn-finger protein
MTKINSPLGIQSSIPNPSFPVVPVHHTTIACHGGGGALGHPKVYLKISRDSATTCPYCSIQYVYVDTGKSTEH